MKLAIFIIVCVAVAYSKPQFYLHHANLAAIAAHSTPIVGPGILGPGYFHPGFLAPGLPAARALLPVPVVAPIGSELDGQYVHDDSGNGADGEYVPDNTEALFDNGEYKEKDEEKIEETTEE